MARWGTLQSDRMRAALYYSRKRRLRRLAAQNSTPAPYDGPRDDDFDDVIYLANFSGITGLQEEDVPTSRTFQAQVGAAETTIPAGVFIDDGVLNNIGGSVINLLSPSDEPLLDIGTNDFCVEGFIKGHTSISNFRAYFAQYTGSPNKSYIFQRDGSSTKISLSSNGSSSSYVTVTGHPLVSTTEFDHLALVKGGGRMGIYVNGVRVWERAYSNLFLTDQPLKTQVQASWTAMRYTARNSRYGTPSAVSSFTPPTPYLGGFPEYGPLEE